MGVDQTKAHVEVLELFRFDEQIISQSTIRRYQILSQDWAFHNCHVAPQWIWMGSSVGRSFSSCSCLGDNKAATATSRLKVGIRWDDPTWMYRLAVIET